MINKLSHHLKRRLKKAAKPVTSSFLALAIIVSGLPLFPGDHISRAFASTINVGANPIRFNTVYGGQTTLKWSFDEKVHDTTLETCTVMRIPPTPTPIPDPAATPSPTGTPTPYTRTSLQAIAEVPAGTNKEYTYNWNGAAASAGPIKQGHYDVCFVPKGSEEYFFYTPVTIINPNPPAPGYIEVVPNKSPSDNKHVIHGIAERGTRVQLTITYTRRNSVGVQETGDTVVLPTVDVPFDDAGDNEGTQLMWSKGKSLDAYIEDPLSANPAPSTYFTDFPLLSGKNQQQKYVREWKTAVELHPYEIANITGTVERLPDNPYYNTEDPTKNKSGVSKITRNSRVLRYIAESWDVKWPHLSGFYYGYDTTATLKTGIEAIANFNNVPIEKCIDMQSCQGPISLGTNLLISNPMIAGKIDHADVDYINEAYFKKYGHPLPVDLDPVNLATGDFSFRQTNMSLQAAMPLSFTATYHSRDIYNGMLGVGWHHSLDWHLEQRAAGHMVVVSPDGANIEYVPTSNEQYYTPPGVFNVLTKKADGSFQLAMRDKSLYTFREDGLLYSMKDANQNVASFVYDGDMLQTVSTPGASMTFTYGPGGKLAKVTDQSGRYVQYHYNTDTNDLTDMVLPDGAVISYAYDKNHRMTQIHNPNQTSTLVNEYDSEGRVARQQDFSGGWGSIQYNPSNKTTTTTDALGHTKAFTYDDRQRNTAIAYADGTSEHYNYDSNDKMTQMTDRNGNTTQYVYDALGNLLQAIDPLSAITNMTYNAFNKPLEITDPLGHKTTLTYDGSGNLTAITDALGRTSTIAVDARGIPTSVMNATGETVTLANDALGFAQTITSPAAGSETLGRDPLHRVTQVMNALQQISRIEYDPRDRVTARIDALNQRETFAYDKNSNLTSHTDVSGATTVYGYDSFNRLTSVTDALHQQTGIAYDAVGNRTKVTDAKGAAAEFSYNNVNRMVQMKDAQGAITKLTYDGNGNVLTQEDPRGGKTTLTYNKRNQPLTVKDAAGATSIYSYDAAGRLIAEANALGQTTSYTYDAVGQLTQMTDALQQITAYQYDKAGRMTQVTQPNGAIWRTEYDMRGLVAATIDPLGNRKEVVRDVLGRVQVAKDELHTPTNYGYDALGRVHTIINGQGSATSLAYDPLGRVKQITDAKQNVTKYNYDALGRLTEVMNALNKQTSYTYDAVGNMTSKTDAKDQTTQYTYNALHQLTKEINPVGKMTQMLYDTIGNVTQVQNPDNTNTNYVYDAMNRLSSIAYADGKSVRYSYDAIGRRSSMIDSVGTTSYQYDQLNRLTQVTDANHQSIGYEWTATGQRKKVIYPDQTAVNYQYDLMDRMTNVTDQQGRTTAYSYDARGLLTGKRLPTQGVSSYNYDVLGQLLEMKQTSPQGKLQEQLNYEYDPIGNRSKVERLVGSTDDKDHNDGDYYDNYDYQGDANHNDEHQPKRTTSSYAYDALNQLVQVQTLNGTNAAKQVTTTYMYDAVGNRSGKSTVKGQTTQSEQYTYDAADKLLRWQSGDDYKTYAYDARGNTTTVTGITYEEDNHDSNFMYDAAGKLPGSTTVSGITYQNDNHDKNNNVDHHGNNDTPRAPKILEQYQWNSANRLVQHVNAGRETTRYTYDGDNNRISMLISQSNNDQDHNHSFGVYDNNGNNGHGNNNNNDEHYKIEYHYTNDVSLALPEPIQVTGADPLHWKQSYVYGVGGERVSMTQWNLNDHNNDNHSAHKDDNSPSSKTQYYLSDALGSVIGLMNEKGGMTARYHYDEFGVPSMQHNNDNNANSSKNMFGYTGLGYDESSGLNYARARYYKPELGRFISEDTYKGTLGNPQSQNEYTYVENNPLTHIDPSGMWSTDITANWTINEMKWQWKIAYDKKDAKKMEYWAKEANNLRDQMRNNGYDEDEIMQSSEASIPKATVDLIAKIGVEQWAASDPLGFGLFYKTAEMTIPTTKIDIAMSFAFPVVGKVFGKLVFRSEELYKAHFEKHANEFGPITKEGYLAGAQSLYASVVDGTNVLSKSRLSDGATLFYKPSTNEFLSVSSDGFIKTYFKPDQSIWADYWNGIKK